MVDAVDSKSTDSNIMWVQVPSPVPIFRACYKSFFCDIIIDRK